MFHYDHRPFAGQSWGAAPPNLAKIIANLAARFNEWRLVTPRHVRTQQMDERGCW
jgi:hypothetical protein